MSNSRRDFMKTAGVAGALGALPASIGRALAIPARRTTGTIKDVRHIVILMQENRSFDHYFGTMRGVRGFGDRHPIPLASGQDVWFQHNGIRELPPFHLDTAKTNAMKVPGTPHSFADAQAAWNQGKFGHWPKFKTDYSMGYYRREDIPFQFALAEAFTLCDAYHCSITTGTDPNRIAFWSGSNFDPALRARGVNCRDTHSEPNNLRCWIKGALPEPGYTYAGNALEWQTIPDVLEAAGIAWRIYQDPNDNWTGAMHGGLAFKSFRQAGADSALYRNGMSHWSLDQLAEDVRKGTLPAVSWVLPPKQWSEHPSTSSPIEGAEYTARVLDALTANPDVWSGTVFFQTFDENDGLFDHVPPPAPPSYNGDGTPAGKATLDLSGHYFDDHDDTYTSRDDNVTGTVRPWGLGPRVPLYVVSPWSKGGWVNSEVADHSSVGQFLERRFGITVPAISPWHRAVCGDLTSCFDFAAEVDARFPDLPEIANSPQTIAEHQRRDRVLPPRHGQQLFQEAGLRRSRALPYILAVDFACDSENRKLRLSFVNDGTAGGVFHVYDRNRLHRIPGRYTVEAGKRIDDAWDIGDDGRFDLWVLGPNGFLRHMRGQLDDHAMLPSVTIRQEPRRRELNVTMLNSGATATSATIGKDAYEKLPPFTLSIPARGEAKGAWAVAGTHDWYDFVVTVPHAEIRAAGRIERGLHGVSDPLSRAVTQA